MGEANRRARFLCRRRRHDVSRHCRGGLGLGFAGNSTSRSHFGDRRWTVIPCHAGKAKSLYTSSIRSASTALKPDGGVPTENPQFGDWFMGKAGLTGKGTKSL